MATIKNVSLKQLKKVYNGAVFEFNPPKPSSKTVQIICNSTSMTIGLTSEKVIREVRKK